MSALRLAVAYFAWIGVFRIESVTNRARRLIGLRSLPIAGPALQSQLRPRRERQDRSISL